MLATGKAEARRVDGLHGCGRPGRPWLRPGGRPCGKEAEVTLGWLLSDFLLDQGRDDASLTDHPPVVPSEWDLSAHRRPQRELARRGSPSPLASALAG